METLSNILNTLWTTMRGLMTDLRGRQRGQSLVIIIFAFIGILALVGLGIDLGLVYVEMVRIGRATDAAALASVSELPAEEAAQARALVYLQENGYDFTGPSTRLVINPDADDESIAGPAEDQARTVIWVDTAHSRDTSVAFPANLNTANRIRVTVRRQVPMTFLQFIGFRQIPVQDSATAENVNYRDVVIVYDESGSMEFDTLCYGCLEGNGNINPLRWGEDPSSPPAVPNHCSTGSTYSDYGGYTHKDEYYHGGGEYYIVIEAEEYSRYDENADYHKLAYTPYRSYWVIQRNDKGSNGRDSDEGYLSHHPYADYRSTSGYGVTCEWDAVTTVDPEGYRYCRFGVPGGPFPAPRVDYDFEVPTSDNYTIWLRGQGGNQSGTRHIFWGVDDLGVQGEEDGFNRGPYYDGASSGAWEWQRLSTGSGDTVYLDDSETHTLHLWAGGAGFDVDRIIITTETEDAPPSTIRGAPPNNARTDWACAPCDPRFAGLPGGMQYDGDWWLPDCNTGANPDQRQDPIYEGEQPISQALISAKNFISHYVDPRLDQIGYVSYDSNSSIRNELECLRRLGPEDCVPDVITSTVLVKLDNTYAGGSTNIAGGIQDGIEVLSTGSSHYGRPGAAHIMILMTDGEANQYPGGPCDDEDLWPADDEKAKDCVIYYAREAKRNNIVIYTISLGYSADIELMDAVADITGGIHQWAPTPENLDKVFEEIFEHIFLRLVD